MILIGFEKEVSLPLIFIPFREPETVMMNEVVWEIFDLTRLNIYAKFVHLGITLALRIENSLELIYAANVGAKYLLVSLNKAEELQKVVEHYMLDAKLLAIVNDKIELTHALSFGIDGAIKL